jgi:hypothetical protein
MRGGCWQRLASQAQTTISSAVLALPIQVDPYPAAVTSPDRPGEADYMRSCFVPRTAAVG